MVDVFYYGSRLPIVLFAGQHFSEHCFYDMVFDFGLEEMLDAFTMAAGYR